MLALTGDDLADFLQGFDQRTWIVLGGIALLWGSKFLPSGLWDKLKSFLPQRATPPEIVPLDDMALIIHQMRLITCDDPPAVREGIAKHLDEIEALLNEDSQRGGP